MTLHFALVRGHRSLNWMSLEGVVQNICKISDRTDEIGKHQKVTRLFFGASFCSPSCLSSVVRLDQGLTSRGSFVSRSPCASKWSTRQHQFQFASKAAA